MKKSNVLRTLTDLQDYHRAVHFGRADEYEAGWLTLKDEALAAAIALGLVKPCLSESGSAATFEKLPIKFGPTARKIRVSTEDEYLASTRIPVADASSPIEAKSTTSASVWWEKNGARFKAECEQQLLRENYDRAMKGI